MGRLIGPLLCAAASIICSRAYAIEADGVTGLPSNVTSLLSMAGTWQPVDDQYVTADCNGSIANSFTGNFTTDGTLREHVIATGWQYCGFDTNAKTTTPVRFAIFRQQNDGTLKIDTSSFASDSLTSGGGSVVIADFNGDGYSDIFLAAHNESPFVGMPSTALLSNGAGGFTKAMLSDHVMAHDAELAAVNGVPTVITTTYGPADKTGNWESFPMYQFKDGAFTQILGTTLSHIDPISGANMTALPSRSVSFRRQESTKWLSVTLCTVPGCPT